MTQGALVEINTPGEWGWERLWSAAPRVQLVGQPGAEPLSVFLQAGVVPRSSREDNHNQLGEDLSKYQVVRPGDLVFNKLRTWQGGLGVSNHHGIVSPAYFVCHPRSGWHPPYLHYLLLSTPYLAELTRLSKFMPPSQFDIPWDMLRTLPLLHPPLDEQRRIADFLDTETARIERVITIRQQQSALSAQRFNLLVDGVVIGDIDALAEIEYGRESVDWKVGKIVRLFSIIPGYAFASEGFIDPAAGTRLLRGINVTPGRIDWEAETVAWDLESSPIDRRYHLRRDDLVVGMDRPWIGSGTRVAVIRETDLPSLLLQRVACIRSRSTSTTRYLRWVLGSSHFQVALEGETTGVSVPHISGDQIGAFMYRLPSPDDQVLLAELLQSHDDLRAAQAALVDRQLTLLAERRRALITAAVTGQIEVAAARGVAV
jgi:type I restriction enzyme S subunit